MAARKESSHGPQALEMKSCGRVGVWQVRASGTSVLEHSQRESLRHHAQPVGGGVLCNMPEHNNHKTPVLREPPLQHTVLFVHGIQSLTHNPLP